MTLRLPLGVGEPRIPASRLRLSTPASRRGRFHQVAFRRRQCTLRIRRHRSPQWDRDRLIDAADAPAAQADRGRSRPHTGRSNGSNESRGTPSPDRHGHREPPPLAARSRSARPNGEHRHPGDGERAAIWTRSRSPGSTSSRLPMIRVETHDAVPTAPGRRASASTRNTSYCAGGWSSSNTQRTLNRMIAT